MVKEDQRVSQKTSVSARGKSADKDRWTHCIIPEVGSWTSRKHGFVTFHLTQVLTGHGCFRKYLIGFGIYKSTECPARPGHDEDVNHALFQCSRSEEERQRLRDLWEGPLPPEGIGRCLLTSQSG